MAQLCPLCSHETVDDWELCRRVERSRGPDGGYASFVEIKRELETAHDIDLTTTGVKRHLSDHADLSAGGARLIREQLFGDAYETTLEAVTADPISELSAVFPSRPLSPPELEVLLAHPAIDGVHGEVLSEWYASVPAAMADDVPLVWIETDTDFVEYVFRFDGIDPRDAYSATMSLECDARWTLQGDGDRGELSETAIHHPAYVHVRSDEATAGTGRDSADATADRSSGLGDAESDPGAGADRSPGTDTGYDASLEEEFVPRLAAEEPGFAQGSHLFPSDIRALSTNEIVYWLRRFGVEFTEERFQRDVRECLSASELADQWWDRYHLMATGQDEDFIWMAAMVLWERLVPDVVSSEQLDRRMQAGYDHRQDGDIVGACRRWLAVWDDLKPRFDDDMTSIHDADARAFTGMQSLFNWCQDLQIALWSAGKIEPRFHERRIEYCREFCDQFPETGSRIIPSMRTSIGESLFALGRVEAAEATFERLTDDFPDDGWAYLRWADVYRESGRGAHVAIPRDDARAAHLYRRALSMDIDPRAATAARNRLADLES